MNTKTYFITGFPGFITQNLVQKIISSDTSFHKLYLLILPSMLENCQNTLLDLHKKFPSLQLSKIELIEGDITKQHLGIDSTKLIQLYEEVTDVFHLAAIYDLAVPKQIAYEVNVNGTINVNDFALSLKKLCRYTYFSTSYVSGKREGKILESELIMGQSFKNYYEETKYYAEIEVEKLKSKLPITIIRPGIVVGHSETGETSKFDGPYFILNFFSKLRFLPFIPQLGRDNATGNFIPINYLIDALYYLSQQEVGMNKTYQITDPTPYSVQDIYKEMLSIYLNKSTFGTIPLGIVSPILSFSKIRKMLKVEKEVLSYFNCYSEYDCSNTLNDLKESNITCPDFIKILPTLTKYYQDHEHMIEKHVLVK